MGIAGAAIIIPVSMGGTLEVQTGMIFLGILVLTTAIKAYINVKRKDILGHRRWMLRGLCPFHISFRRRIFVNPYLRMRATNRV
jgi:hypothetical protein